MSCDCCRRCCWRGRDRGHGCCCGVVGIVTVVALVAIVVIVAVTVVVVVIVVMVSAVAMKGFGNKCHARGEVYG